MRPLQYASEDLAGIIVEARSTGDGATLWTAFASHGELHGEGHGLSREVAIAAALIALGAEMLKAQIER